MATRTASDSPIAVFQFRADPELLQKVKEFAARDKVSANRYLTDAVKNRIAMEKAEEWRKGYEAMGRDPDMDVEYMIHAAGEVIFAE